MKKILKYILALSILSVVYSFVLPTYSNEEEFFSKYLSIDRHKLGSREASRQFFELRREYLTEKFVFQDYAFTVLILAMVGLKYFGKNKKIYTPSTKIRTAVIGIVAALLTTAALILDTLLQFKRHTSPYWADSMGIPIAGAMSLGVVLFFWSILNTIGLRGRFQVNVPISYKGIRATNYFYLIFILITFLFTMLVILEGVFLLIIPGFTWLYYYSSLWAGRRAANNCLQRTN